MMHGLRRLKNIAFVHLPILLKVEAKRRWPTLFDRVPLRATAAWLNPTDNCNMRCIMCNQWRVTKTDELTTQEWKDVLGQLKEAGIEKVGLNGGEPLLRKDIVDIVAHISSLGLSPALITSGYLLDENKLDALIAAGLQHLTVSIDRVGEEYEKIRHREWPRVENAARLVARRYNEGKVDANIGFVVMHATLGHLPGVRRFAGELGLPLMLSLVDSTPFFFQIPENEHAAKDTNWVAPPDRPRLKDLQRELVEMKSGSRASMVNTYADLDYMSSYFSDPLQADVPCTVSQLRIMINSHGEVYGGCWSMGSYGCLRKQSLREILSSDAYRRAHRAMFYKECPGCCCGYTTNVRYSLPLQWRDQLFRLLPARRRTIFAGAPGRTIAEKEPAAL